MYVIFSVEKSFEVVFLLLAVDVIVREVRVVECKGGYVFNFCTVCVILSQRMYKNSVM